MTTTFHRASSTSSSEVAFAGDALRRQIRCFRSCRLERVTRIELALSAWEADVLPLNYPRGWCVGIVPGNGSRIRWFAATVDRPHAIGRFCDHLRKSWVSAGAGDGQLCLQQLSQPGGSTRGPADHPV